MYIKSSGQPFSSFLDPYEVPEFLVFVKPLIMYSQNSFITTAGGWKSVDLAVYVSPYHHDNLKSLQPFSMSNN